MKQCEGELYATGMGIVTYNFRLDDQSVYSEPGLRYTSRKPMLVCLSLARRHSKT